MRHDPILFALVVIRNLTSIIALGSWADEMEDMPMPCKSMFAILALTN